MSNPAHYELIHNEFNSNYARGNTDGYASAGSME